MDGLLASAYLHQDALQPALAATNEAIDANREIPDELYFVPKNLAIKAEIMGRLGDVKASNDLYEKSADLLDGLMSKVPTPMIERQLLSDLSTVYAGYFVSLTNQGRLADAFRVIERARGRLEAQALAHHEVIAPGGPDSGEVRLTSLNVQLLNSNDPKIRSKLLTAIYAAEQQLPGGASAIDIPPKPVPLEDLQRDLRASELLVEYVHSYALAITRGTVHRYTLPLKSVLEHEALQYRSELVEQNTDLPLAQHLFDGLLGGIPEFKEKQAVIVVPDGKLHLLPFSALMNSGQYVLNSHLVTVAPSGTVLDMLRHRTNPTQREDLPYLGVGLGPPNRPQ